MQRPILISYLLLASVLLGASAALLTTGYIPFSEVWPGALDRLAGKSSAWNALLDERLPRLIVLICTGAALATAGAVMQSLLQNPLAAPTILGLTAGSSLMVLIVFISGLHLLFNWAVPFAAIAGSLAVLLLISAFWKSCGGRPFSVLILLGLAVATLLLATQNALLYAYRDNWQLIQMITEWEAGSTFDRSWEHVHMQLPLTIIGLIICYYYRNELNILALGEDEARTLGVDVVSVRWRLIISVSLLSGGATAALGSVPFFGLILPHLVRQVFSSNHRLMIPLCMLSGSSMLVLFDVLLRTSGIDFLTIGNLSALCGGVFFLLLLRRNSNAYSWS